MLSKVVGLITSLKLTIACLAGAMALVLAGTFAQVHLGIHLVQQRYFQSLFVWWPPEGGGFRIPVFPGGYLVGGLLLTNLIAAHVRRFQWTWRKLGIHLTHAGLIVMLAGGLFTDLFSAEGHMRLNEGKTKNYSEHPRLTELAVIDTTASDFDQVTAIPEALLRHKRWIEHASLPFRIVVRHFYQNSRLRMLNEAQPNARAAAGNGIGARVAVDEVPRATGVDDRDIASAVIQIVPISFVDGMEAGSLGTWLVSDALGASQTFSWGGREWSIALRPARYYKPYSVTLQKFTHERYAGTEIPKNFASRITLIDPERAVNRDVLIYMNHPLRYRGETLYQSGFDKNDHASIFRVVHNPTFVAPYIACLVVAVGLLFQFGYHLVGFVRERRGALA